MWATAARHLRSHLCRNLGCLYLHTSPPSKETWASGSSIPGILSDEPWSGHPAFLQQQVSQLRATTQPSVCSDGPESPLSLGPASALSCAALAPSRQDTPWQAESLSLQSPWASCPVLVSAKVVVTLAEAQNKRKPA